ncbi:MAG: hypothetical protein LBE75_03165 [Burkholderiales bacterium]|jgi:hypothetical protein|nr:hypothetical protein [Burkholderiales bacterium]
MIRSLVLAAIAALIAGAAGGGWYGYERGKDVGAASATKRLNELHEKVLAGRAEDLAFAIEKFEETKNDAERMRQYARAVERKSNARSTALDAALASLRFRAAEGGGSAVPGTAASAAEPDVAAAQCRPCATELEAVTIRAAHDALTVMEWQKFYEAIRTGDFSVPAEK